MGYRYADHKIRKHHFEGYRIFLDFVCTVVIDDCRQSDTYENANTVLGYISNSCKYFDIFQRHEQNLALPSVEKAALECVKAGLETWEYKAKNALMYYPEGKKAEH